MTLGRRGITCAMHHEWDGCKEESYMGMTQTKNNRIIMACDLLLFAAAMTSFARLPLDHNKMLL